MKIGRGYLEKVGNGELTFVGVLNRYFDENGSFEAISAPWGEDTRRQYVNDYEKRLIPYLNNRIPLSEYTEEEFIKPLIRIGKSNRYTRERMMHYRYLMWRVYNAGLQNQLYDDNIEWGKAGLTAEWEVENSPEEVKKRQILNKRSFSRREAKVLLDYFRSLDPKMASGENIGLFLMFLYGLRNNEAVALDYAAVRRIGKGRIPCIIVRQSAEQSGRKKKASGKTRNANRIIPIFESTYSFLMSRKNYMEEVIKGSDLEDVDGSSKVVSLPIVCSSSNLTQMLLSRELTAAGRELFKKLKIGTHAVEATHQTLFQQRLNGVDIGEKDPTTYLMRRNFATRLYCLGLRADQVEYLLGHDVESADISRNDYVNEDLLHELKVILDKDPYNLYLYFEEQQETPRIDSIQYFEDISASQQLILSAGEEYSSYYIQIRAKEPMDNIRVTMQSDGIIKSTLIQTVESESEKGGRPANIRDKVLIQGKAIRKNEEKLF